MQNRTASSFWGILRQREPILPQKGSYINLKGLPMKRIFTLLLYAAMALSATACSHAGTALPTVTSAPTQVPTEPPALFSPEETVLVDNEDAAFSVVKAESLSQPGMRLYVRCVNKGSRTLMFSWDMVSVCGYMYDPLWAVEVAPGKTADSTIELDAHALAQMDIRSADEVSFTLRIYDSENWMEPHIVQDAFTLYPTGLTAETTVLPQRIPRDGQVVIADDENIRFVIESVDTQDSGCTAHVYMENKTNRNLMYTWDRVSVNGKMIDPLWAVSVVAGKKACSEISFLSSDLEANGITEITSIGFRLIISDYDDWSAPNLLEETYTYNPMQ